MAMIGVPLCTYKEELRKIPNGVLPTRTIDRFLERLAAFPEEMEEVSSGYDPFDPFLHCSRLPLGFWNSCAVEERVKIYCSSVFMLEQSYYDLFEQDPTYAIFRKIKSSLWRYGYVSLDTEWNTLVDAYNGIRNFSFGIPDFEVTLNYTRGHSAYSHSEFDHDLYLDGVFGFVVHYVGEPVMTIGFSFAEGRRILIAQVQMKKPKGNRFLYKLPMDRVAFVVMLMKKYFPDFRHYLVDGAQLVERYVEEYRMGVAAELAHHEPNQEQICTMRAKILSYQGEVGSQIRRTYSLDGDAYALSPHRPVFMHHRHYMRIVRS